MIYFYKTPYFGIFGDNSHFNTVKEALGYGMNYFNSIETGLSADPLNFYSKWRSRMRIIYYTVNIISIFNIANSIQKEQANMLIIEGEKSKTFIFSIRPDERFMKKQLQAAQALNERMQNFFLIILTTPNINLIQLLMS